jgi:hypothetical protein
MDGETTLVATSTLKLLERIGRISEKKKKKKEELRLPALRTSEPPPKMYPAGQLGFTLSDISQFMNYLM